MAKGVPYAQSNVKQHLVDVCGGDCGTRLWRTRRMILPLVVGGQVW
jgi:hypothetical protein